MKTTLIEIAEDVLFNASKLRDQVELNQHLQGEHRKVEGRNKAVLLAKLIRHDCAVLLKEIK